MVLDNSQGDRLDRQRAMASGALERWAGFPVDANPRPWVFVGPVIGPEVGFRTGAAKISFMKADINMAVPIPDDVLAHIRQYGITSGVRPSLYRWKSTVCRSPKPISAPTEAGCASPRGVLKAPTSSDASGCSTLRSWLTNGKPSG